MSAFLRDRVAQHYETLEEDVIDHSVILRESLRESLIPKELHSSYYSNLLDANKGSSNSLSEVTKVSSRAYVEMPKREIKTLTKGNIVQSRRPNLQRLIQRGDLGHAKKEKRHGVLTKLQTRPKVIIIKENKMPRKISPY